MVGFGVLGTATWAVLAAALWVVTSRRFREIAGRVAFEPERRVRPRRPARPEPTAGSEAVLDVLPLDDKSPGGDGEDKNRGSQLPSTEGDRASGGR